MDELSSVLREVLRALGMEGAAYVHLPRDPEGGGERGDGAEEELASG